MATKQQIIDYAMYVVGEVESNWTWNAVPAFDGVSHIISIGMMQSAGSNAADLLQVIHDDYPTTWQALAITSPRLTNDVLTIPHTWNNWSNYSLTDVERISVATILDTPDGHSAQMEYWAAICGGYIDYLLSVGFSLSRPKPLIFAISMYHQSPQSCNNVIATVGGNADLAMIHTACLNNPVLGQYTNRYNTVYSRLNSWNEQDPPPNFGQNSTPSTGGQTPGNTQTNSLINYITKNGDQLVLFGSAFTNGLIFIPTQGDKWIPMFNTSGAQPGGGFQGGGTPAPSPTPAEQVAAQMLSWVGMFDYSQAAGRLDPVNTGFGDCSSVVWAAYFLVTGINVGTWTGDQIHNGTLIDSGDYGSTNIANLKPADLLLIDWDGAHSFTSAGHVEMFVGNNQLCGHGGPGKGPTIKNGVNSYIANCPNWQIRRYL